VNHSILSLTIEYIPKDNTAGETDAYILVIYQKSIKIDGVF